MKITTIPFFALILLLLVTSCASDDFVATMIERQLAASNATEYLQDYLTDRNKQLHQ